eukprot:Rhum_TRINITY_DN14439_c11_g2::Rhum_TRINITY_DN14439_c11_g2_i1::g.92085::m.92085
MAWHRTVVAVCLLFIALAKGQPTAKDCTTVDAVAPGATADEYAWNCINHLALGKMYLCTWTDTLKCQDAGSGPPDTALDDFTPPDTFACANATVFGADLCNKLTNIYSGTITPVGSLFPTATPSIKCLWDTPTSACMDAATPAPGTTPTPPSTNSTPAPGAAGTTPVPGTGTVSTPTPGAGGGTVTPSTPSPSSKKDTAVLIAACGSGGVLVLCCILLFCCVRPTRPNPLPDEEVTPQPTPREMEKAAQDLPLDMNVEQMPVEALPNEYELLAPKEVEDFEKLSTKPSDDRAWQEHREKSPQRQRQLSEWATAKKELAKDRRSHVEKEKKKRFDADKKTLEDMVANHGRDSLIEELKMEWVTGQETIFAHINPPEPSPSSARGPHTPTLAPSPLASNSPAEAGSPAGRLGHTTGPILTPATTPSPAAANGGGGPLPAGGSGPLPPGPRPPAHRPKFTSPQGPLPRSHVPALSPPNRTRQTSGPFVD